MTDYKALVWDGLLDISAYIPGKPLKKLKEELGLKDAVKLASNENPYGPSPLAIAALEEYKKEITRYPIGDSLYLREAIADFHGISADNVLCGAGSDEIIQLLYMTFMSEKCHALSPAPSFSEYELLARGLKSSCRWVNTKEDFSVDFDAVLKAVTPQTRFIMLANPNNPTGKAFTEEEFVPFMDKVPENTLVALDEAYIEFAEANIPDAVSLMKKYPNLMTMRTFSKAYGLASIRCGYLIAHADCIALINRIRPPFNVNSAAQIMAEAALKDKEHIKTVVAKNKEGREYLYKEMEKAGLEYVPTEANFMLIKVGDGEKVFNALLKEGVITRFLGGAALKDYIRVSIGSMEENGIFVNALNKIMKK